MISFDVTKFDQIHIKDLLLRAIIGINADERTKRQDALINITLYANLHSSGRTDELRDTVNYRTITKHIIAMVESSSFYLVERLAEEIAVLCLVDPKVMGAKIRVEKPGALRFARSVGVEIFRSRETLSTEGNRVFITLGSNIEPEYNVCRALELLATLCQIDSVSPVYLTNPVGRTDQPMFLNAAIGIKTPLSASALKHEILLPIEDKLHRKREPDKNAPRTIDLDIALFNYEVLEVNDKTIPASDVLEFAHVAVPLADIAPYYVHPVIGKSIKEKQ